MPKIKLAVKQPHIDMTPMVDLFMLLLTFFMLTGTLRPPDAALIDTPTSVSDKQAPDKNVITLFIDKTGKVFFNMDNGKDTTTQHRVKILEKMGEKYGIGFSYEEKAKFKNLSSFGLPMKNFKKWLNATDSKEKELLQSGIPTDSADNQLALWIRYTRLVNPSAEAAIKGDRDADYKAVKKVFDLLQDNKINKFSLTTGLEKVEVKLSEIKGGK